MTPAEPARGAAAPTSGRADFEASIRRAGLVLTAGDMDRIHPAWELLQPLLARIRGQGRDRAAPPAPVFPVGLYLRDDVGAERP